LLELELNPERAADFKVLMSEMVALAETQPGTLVYEWYFNEDKTRCIINERYRDSTALIDHMEASGPYAERFIAAATISRLTILGDVDTATRAALVSLEPSYLSIGEGFSRGR
jgi:quinol monooxygenase YgiN